MADPPIPFDDDESRVENIPRAAGAQQKRKLGLMEEEGSVSLTQPSPLKKGTRQVPRGTVGLRAATERQQPSEKVVAARGEAERQLQQSKDSHRQKVWDKLDAARKAADERLPRYTGFRPKRER
ncbi:MAG: hypothetical protein H7Z43_09530 [Clostridia bacterium]|nr:hypothetical protein [Deltaproteobacteria bacterium]